MQIASVVGMATTTVKHATLVGAKLLVVQPLAADGKQPDGDPVLAVDQLGAGVGERVLVTSDGRAARELMGSDATPVRWTVQGICDQ